MLNTGESFAFTFNKPGRYEYYCELHTGLMFGSVQVGADRTRPELTRLRAELRRTGVGVSVTSSEDAKLAATLAPAARPRRVRRYRVWVTATDREGNVARRARAILRVPGR